MGLKQIKIDGKNFTDYQNSFSDGWSKNLFGEDRSITSLSLYTLPDINFRLTSEQGETSFLTIGRSGYFNIEFTTPYNEIRISETSFQKLIENNYFLTIDYNAKEEMTASVLGVKFKMYPNGGYYPGERVGAAAKLTPGADFNNFEMYRDRELGLLNLTTQKFISFDTWNSFSGKSKITASEAEEYGWNSFGAQDGEEYLTNKLNSSDTFKYVIRQPNFYYKTVQENGALQVEISSEYHIGFDLIFPNTDVVYISREGVMTQKENPSVSTGTLPYLFDNIFRIQLVNSQRQATDKEPNDWTVRINKNTGKRDALLSTTGKTTYKLLDNEYFYNYRVLAATQMLFMVEYASLDIQSALGDGLCNIPYTSTYASDGTDTNLRNNRDLFSSSDENVFLELRKNYGSGISNDRKIEIDKKYKQHYNYRWEKDIWSGPFKTYVDIELNLQDKSEKEKKYYFYDKEQPYFTASTETNYFRYPKYFSTEALKQLPLFIGEIDPNYKDDTTSSDSVPDIIGLYSNKQMFLMIGGVFNEGIKSDGSQGSPNRFFSGIFRGEFQSFYGWNGFKTIYYWKKED